MLAGTAYNFPFAVKAVTADGARSFAPTVVLSSASSELVSRYFEITLGSKLGVARSGPCPVAQAAGSFCEMVSQG